MKFKITKAALLAGLQRVQNIVGMRSTLPILANTLLNADEKKLWFTTTDLDVTIRCSVEAEIQKGGSTTMPVKRLSGIARELPDKTIEIEISDKDEATLKCESSFFKIIGMKSDEFSCRFFLKLLLNLYPSPGVPATSLIESLAP